MGSKRDDFTEKTKIMIAKRVGWLCSYPACRVATVGATSDPDSVINIGTLAHICAAAPGGSRYDPSMSPEQRSSAENGMLMCQNHGEAIDSQDSTFTVDKSREWKRQAEAESRQRVLGGKTMPGPDTTSETRLVSQIRNATKIDIGVFRNTSKWPSTSVSLMLKMDGIEEPVTTSVLANVVVSLDDLLLVAPPGMGKTTTIFQIAETMLSNGNAAPLVVQLGDWATSNTTLLDSILKCPAFHEISEENFRKAVSQTGFVLMLDGWNELDSLSRKRARVEVEALKAELPELGLIISTRKQSLDVPFEGMKIDLMPLNEEQQMLIAFEMHGDSGTKILDQAWRSPGGSRYQAASIAMLATHAPSSRLLSILKRLLDNELYCRREFIKQAEAKRWQQFHAVTEARLIFTDMYALAFSKIKSPETVDLMKEYLKDDHFGMDAARVLAGHWIAKNELHKDNIFFSGVNFSTVKEKRMARATNPDLVV